MNIGTIYLSTDCPADQAAFFNELKLIKVPQKKGTVSLENNFPYMDSSSTLFCHGKSCRTIRTIANYLGFEI